jgi:hypothetical protein
MSSLVPTPLPTMGMPSGFRATIPGDETDVTVERG